MNKQKLLEIFDEVLEGFEDAESFAIANYHDGIDDYSHEDLARDIEEYKQLFLKALG